MNVSTRESTAHLLNKVPEVTLVFWLIKIMCTTVGETAADFLIFNLNFGLLLTSLLMVIPLAIFLVIQIRHKKYVPWLYWVTVVLISIVGTLITDNLVDNLGVPLELTTIAFSIALLLAFALWYASENTLSIHTIYTRRRELFYWAAILFTFALGTAAGDLVAESLNLGYVISAMIFGGLIGLVSLDYYVFKSNAVLSFWIAYILTRPLGASIGDYLSQPADKGGLGLSSIAINLIFLIAILGLVRYLTLQQRNAIPQRRGKDLKH
ncbi:MAG: hypothetical protein ABL911_09715 [Gallionella sp.]